MPRVAAVIDAEDPLLPPEGLEALMHAAVTGASLVSCRLLSRGGVTA